MRTATWMMITALACLTMACGGGSSTSSGAAAPSEEGRPLGNIVRPRAAYELRCPAAQVQITEISPLTYDAGGCGAQATYACVGAMGRYTCSREGDVQGAPVDRAPVAVGSPVDKSGAPVGTIVVPRAAHDLGCDAGAIAIREIADKTYAASGCAKEALYVCVGAMGRYQCQRE